MSNHRAAADLFQPNSSDFKMKKQLYHSAAGFLYQVSGGPAGENDTYDLRMTISMLDPSTEKIVKRIEVQPDGTEKTVSATAHFGVATRAGETLQEALNRMLRKKAFQLEADYQSQYRSSLKNKVVDELTLANAVAVYLDDAAYKRSPRKSSQESFRSKINTIAKDLAAVKIGEIKKKDLQAIADGKSAKTRQGYLNALLFFLNFIESSQQQKSAVTPLILKEIGRLAQQDSAAANRRKELSATNSDALPDLVEEEFNRIVVSNWQSDCRYAALLLVKGSGLLLSDICALKIGDIYTCANKEMVFVRLFRSFVSATQNYTFPLFPFEARVINDYLASLPDTRRSQERFLFSSDADGLVPLESKDITNLCRAELNKLRFGYSALIGNRSLKKDNGINILSTTYRMRLKKYCNLAPETDEGAYKFMVHESLTTMVQADHYRSFTGESGQQMLYDYVRHDRRFIKQRDPNTRSLPIPKSALEFPAQPSSHDQQYEIQIGPFENARQISIITQNGASFEIELLP